MKKDRLGVKKVTRGVHWVLQSIPFSPQELAALKNKLRGAFGDTTDFARDITQQLEAKLGRNIDDLRDRIEQEVAQHKKEMEDTYRDRVSGALAGL